MDLPAVQLLCLKQQDRSLEDHTRDFLDLACLTHFPDRSLSVFYHASLSEPCKARLPANGPREDFAAFVEWALESNGLYFSVCPVQEDLSSPTPDPEPSQLSSPRSTEHKPEPTAAAQPKPVAIKAPRSAAIKATEDIIAPEIEPDDATDQVCEPATLCNTVGVLVEIEGLEGDWRGDILPSEYEYEGKWFGDLVTPVWWEDVWLKEGFAHYFEYIGTDFLFPKWNMEKQRFLTDVLHEVMLLDGLASSHPISQEVFEATDIDRVFDWIAYKKGAALIRMLANVMGQPLFQRGLNDYLMTHMYGNAARDDLWNKFSEAMQREGKDINITQVMDRWTLQMGYPVVTISKNESLDNSVTISQEHFVYDTEAKIQNPELFNKSFQWQIPLTLAVGNASHISTDAIIWVSNKTETHRVGHVDGETWLLGNINQTGYFRVNYDLHNWRLLIQQLMTNPTIISVGNRAGLIDDVFNLARAGYLPQNVPLQMISYLSQEAEFLPWHAASRALYQLDKLLDRTEDHSLFSDYVLRQVEPKYHKLGWPATSPDGSFMQAAYQAEELQREVIMLACSFGNKHCHRQAVSLISDWISSNKNRIPPNVRDIVYCTGVSLMDEDVWEFIWMKFHSSTAISEKKVLLEALTCSDNIFLLNRLLNLSLTSDLVPDQEVIDVIIHVGRNPVGRHLAWRYLREKWDILNSRYGEALFMNSKLISGVTEFLNTEAELNELKEFILNSGEESAPAFARAVEIVQANVKWHVLFQQQFYRWLRKAPNG
ncbi:thyrotropin-releasing hormone-degrading ectoenzyme-like [Garra rufa]|uniref:thyrotropin-releasing hormone-degrading ectoenzyme-like n=1 Tax=Garra rufa TaxID=137080 RepID=UPI003CCEA788